MSDKSSDEEYIWSPHGKSVSHLTSSEHIMSDERKEIIRQALEFDIIDIRTSTGYRGDLLVEITTMDPNVSQSLKEISENLGLETVIHKSDLMIYKIYCITASTNGYEFK